ncbi:hypothetical protein [Bradyrhizobium lablabi]|uniref:hypothetical protein n=1 Tax=Bradyrhizobium lablabi TaxID=722472 RepID=UPI00090AF28A|nr:hypothetical protein [Bradyrhizobium lablabi]SHL47446.1 hypothetical protein SAMN05444321_3015 [Bradyrhizobium lablabi]
MSVKNTDLKPFWDLEIVERTSAWQSPIAAECAAFDEHKNVLLDKLRNGHKLGSKSDPFDATQSWHDLHQLAKFYFLERTQKTMGAADTVKRLRQLARALRHARNLVSMATRDDVGADLFRAWLDTQKITKDSLLILEINDKKVDVTSELIRSTDKMKEAVEGLAALETAARAAILATDVLSKKGRAPLLPRDCIQGLARVYRKSTGAKPGRGIGPFADFAYLFMTAVGQTGFDYGSLTDAIQDAHQKFKPSWFDENDLGGKPPPY